MKLYVLDLGKIVMMGDDPVTKDGGENPAIPIHAFLIDSPAGCILFDTGSHPQAMEGAWPKELCGNSSVPGEHGSGDCVMGYAQLAHTASAMGETAAENAMGMEAHYDESTCPTCVYILPEADCKARGLDYLCGKFPMAGNGKALILNGGEGLVKILADKESHKVLGMHIIGPLASDPRAGNPAAYLIGAPPGPFCFLSV